MRNLIESNNNNKEEKKVYKRTHSTQHIAESKMLLN